MSVEVDVAVQAIGFGLVAAVGVWYGSDTENDLWAPLAVLCFSLGLGTVIVGMLIEAVAGGSPLAWVGLVHGAIGALALLVVPLRQLVQAIRSMSQ